MKRADKEPRTKAELLDENERLRTRLDEAEQTIAAIQSGEVDALVISSPQGEQIFSLTGAEHIYRVIVEAMNEGAVTIDLGGYILFCNPRFSEIMKTPMAEVVGRRLTNFAASPQQPIIRALVADAQAGSVRRRLVMKAAGGTPVPVQLSATLLVAATPPCICVVVSDLTELEASANSIKILLEREHAIEESQAALRQQYDWLQVTLSSIGDAVIAADGEGRITFINPVASALTTWMDEEEKGRPVGEVFRVINDQTREPAEDIFRRVMREGSTAKLADHTTLITRDGREIPIEVSAAPIKESDGHLSGVVIVFHDVTDKRQAAETQKKHAQQLEATNMELESFSYSVSHDLRAPLRAIDGFSRMLLKDLAETLNDEGRRKLNVIRDNTQKMGRLIDDLLALSRLGRQSLFLAPVDMNKLVRNIWTEQSALYPDREMDLQMEPLPEAFADLALIRQVLYNLISNAIKYSREKKQTLIAVGCRPDGMENVYWLRDNGIGFDMQYRDKLFGAFQRLHSDSDYDGTGVGLAIVQRIILRHGGRVWAEGKVDEGATFYFSLPAKRGDGSRD